MTAHNQPEHFIPLSRFALLQQLQDEILETQRESYLQFLQSLAEWRHYQFNQNLLQLKSLYLPFSPDRDTLQVLNFSDAELQEKQQQLVDLLSSLLSDANYTRITADDLDAIFSAQSAHGLELKVDLSEFEQLLLYSRGSTTDIQEIRDWKTLYLKKKKIEVPIYQRLFLLLKLKPEQLRIQEIMARDQVDAKKAEKTLRKLRSTLPENIDSEHIHLKLFKRIPQVDLEMMFPNTRVQLKTFDKFKLAVTAGGGTLGSVAATATKFAAAANPLSAAGALAGLAAVIFRQVTKFFTQRTKYMMLLAQRLYFHNLANNRGVLTLLVDRAEEEEIKEGFLLYHTLLKHGNFRTDTLPEIKQEIETMLRQRYSANLNFDINDPLSQLFQDHLVTVDSYGEHHLLPPEEALKQLCKLRMERLKTVDVMLEEISEEAAI